VKPSPSKPQEVLVSCSSLSCAFVASQNPEGIPVLFVDEQIYRELPSFLVATVDKFAMLPWRGETGMLFGRVSGRTGRKFFGPMDKERGEHRLPDGLVPPELIVQDELHLISGPLGTMVGLYETAVEALCTRTTGGATVMPKIIAATATVRRARQQVQALFGRREMAVFPPSGVNDSDSYFARTDTSDAAGRLYVGVAASGRALKAILIRVYASLLASGKKVWDPSGAVDQPADAYMTVVGYFNSLRELGGMRRLAEDEVRKRAAEAESRRPEKTDAHPWYKNRPGLREPVELTSRESTAKISESRGRLAGSFKDEDSVDVVLASNMISVGIDIDRLGVMVVAGQPKTTSEYIQASSRVGRTTRWPGLVVTCFNVHKPRDRSHYERFSAYHESFYRFVEAMSLTPFSGPALDRGLAGTFVSMARLLDKESTPPSAAMSVPSREQVVARAIENLVRRAEAQPLNGEDGSEALALYIRKRAKDLVDAWATIAKQAKEDGANRGFSRFDKEKSDRPLLRTMLDSDPPPPGTPESKFYAPTSMRDVEPVVHLWVTKYLGAKDDAATKQ
jgi:hypothetical protein